MKPVQDLDIESLVFRWPKLFEKSDISEVQVGPGWEGILEAFCESIYHRVEQCENRLEYYRDAFEKNPSNELMPDLIAGAEDGLREAIDELPIITSIRQKFGHLRIGMISDNDIHSYYAIFAQNMSRRICEDCGAPGQMFNLPGSKVLCNRDKKLRELADTDYVRYTPKPGPYLSDETPDEI